MRPDVVDHVVRLLSHRGVHGCTEIHELIPTDSDHFVRYYHLVGLELVRSCQLSLLVSDEIYYIQYSFCVPPLTRRRKAHISLYMSFCPGVLYYKRCCCIH